MTPATQRSARVQAATVRMRDAFVAERFGEPARQVFREKATPELREIFTRAKDPPGGWVPFDRFVEANVLADRLFGKGDLALVREMGRFAANHNIGVWKGLIMRHVPPSMLLSITAGLWSHHYDGGRLSSSPAGPTSMIVRIHDFPTPHRAHCLSVAGWVEGSLSLGPRKNVEATETSCAARGDALCELRISWA
jgi:hypothetical protein